MRPKKIGVRSPLRVPAVSAKKNCVHDPFNRLFKVKGKVFDCQDG